MSANATAKSGGSGLMLLTIAFFVAKVTGYIDWPWIWVFSPLWIPAALVMVFFVIALVVIGIAHALESEQERKARKAREAIKNYAKSLR